MTVESVAHAAATPDHPQPYRELGLKDDEYQRIRDLLGRRPTDAELFAWAADRIDEPAARPTRIHVVPVIPVTAIGKVFKPELRRQATADAAADVLAAEGLDTAVEAVLTDAGVELVLPADAATRAEAALLSLALPLRRNA